MIFYGIISADKSEIVKLLQKRIYLKNRTSELKTIHNNRYGIKQRLDKNT